MKPIVPFEPVLGTTLPSGDMWLAQVKWDGVRLLTYADGETVQLFNRHGREKSRHYPELLNIQAYTTAKSVILDGEVIALGADGKPSFHEVMRRDGLRHMSRVAFVAQNIPIVYMAFDILYLNGEWLVEKPLTERMDALHSVLHPTSCVHFVESHTEAGPLFQATKEHGLEGVVMKRRHSPYVIGGKSDAWVKMKHYADVHCVIGGYRQDVSGIVKSLLLGVYRDSGLHYVGAAGPGRLSSTEWKTLVQKLAQQIELECSFSDNRHRILSRADSRVSFVQPTDVVKVQYIEWTRHGTLRQPVIQAVVDVAPEVCTPP